MYTLVCAHVSGVKAVLGNGDLLASTFSTSLEVSPSPRFSQIVSESCFTAERKPTREIC